jgi:hypothetical protein
MTVPTVTKTMRDDDARQTKYPPSSPQLRNSNLMVNPKNPVTDGTLVSLVIAALTFRPVTGFGHLTCA